MIYTLKANSLFSRRDVSIDSGFQAATARTEPTSNKTCAHCFCSGGLFAPEPGDGERRGEAHEQQRE